MPSRTLNRAAASDGNEPPSQRVQVLAAAAVVSSATWPNEGSVQHPKIKKICSMIAFIVFISIALQVCEDARIQHWHHNLRANANGKND